MKKMLKESLQWIAAVVVPMIAAFAIYVIGYFLSMIGAAHMIGIEAKEYYEPVILAICNGPAGFVVPYLAYEIAPKGKMVTAIVLGTIGATLQCVAIAMNFGQWWLNLSSLCNIVGTVVGIVKAVRGSDPVGGLKMVE